MANKATISKEQILDTAYDLASRNGLAGLGIREVAGECGVSVGSVYNYFPSKAQLIADVVGMYWERSMARGELHPHPGEGFLPFCRRLSGHMEEPIRRFREEWSGRMKSLDAQSLAVAHQQESRFFAHIEKGLGAVLLRDGGIDRAKLEGALAPERLCPFVWRSLVEAHRRGDGSQDVLFALLEDVLG